MRRHFTVKLDLSYYDDPEADKERERAIRTGSLPVPVGGFWQYSVSQILHGEDNRDLATQSVLQIEAKTLKELVKDLFNRLPRYLEEQGLRKD